MCLFLVNCDAFNKRKRAGILSYIISVSLLIVSNVVDNSRAGECFALLLTDKDIIGCEAEIAMVFEEAYQYKRSCKPHYWYAHNAFE